MTAQDPITVTTDERAMLEYFVDMQRRELKETLEGISEADARRNLVPSLTTLIGLVKHNTIVERNWFQHRLLQIPREELPLPSSADEHSWVVRDDETVADVLAEYDAACEESRTNAAKFPLDHVVPHQHWGQVSLRWIYLHMIEEVARHAGHADILREQIEATPSPS
ncbi:DinB family protein [Rhizocola hellebori]|nr:DinB family protein [Rhizocola hellebori]